jgi:SpoVK/Ycf46/Vps4 family AAA+-type ATPase
LLQQIQSHPGLVILASNFKTNIDTAFTRRLESIIEFEMPSYNERLKLWRNNLAKNIEIAKDVNLKKSHQDFNLKLTLQNANSIKNITSQEIKLYMQTKGL